MSLQKPNFYNIPTIVASEVSPHEAFVFSVVYWFEKMKDGVCFASNNKIAEALPYKSSIISVANALAVLEEKGFIKRVFKDENKRERERIVCLVDYRRDSFKMKGDSPTGEGGIHPQVKGDSPTGEHSINININNEDSTTSNEVDSLSSEEESEFIYKIPVDADGQPIEKPGKKVKSKDYPENSPEFQLAYLWRKSASEATGLPEDKIPMSKFLFVLNKAKKRDGLSPEDVKSIFKYFFRDTRIENKTAIQLCLSDSYVAQWRVNKKKKDTNMNPWNLYDNDE